MQADKDEIRARNDIVEVLGAYVSLRKRGRNWQGLCPFHQEKTPSFHADPVTQTFRCFGCGASGDVFTFIERHENMTFVEAAELLARRVGLSFARQGAPGPPPGERERLYDANARAAEFYRGVLEKAAAPRDYLQRRGLAKGTLERFALGFAPEGWTSLVGFLRSRKVDLRDAEKAGLLHVGRTGEHYDAFRQRIVFPIHDEQERIVGFGGRAMGEEQPKYLNTGETPIFAKSRLLYGLPFARRKVAAEGRSLLMEGYMDVIAAHQAGFGSALATLGTSLTEEHARKLARLAPVVVLVYDADNAGIRATLRASEILEKEGAEVRVVRLPEGDDPDSLLRRGESAAFQRAVDGALGRVEYQLERVLATSSTADDAALARTLRKIVAILATVPSRAERDAYMERVWRVHPLSVHGPGVAKEQLHRDAEAYAAGARGAGRQPARPVLPPSQAGGAPPTPAHGPSAAERAEAQILRALAEPRWRRVALGAAAPDNMVTPFGRELIQFVSAHAEELAMDEEGLVSLLDRDAEPAFSLAARERLQEFGMITQKEPLTQALIEGSLRTLRRHRMEALKSELVRFLKDQGELTSADRDRVAELNRLLRELQSSSGAAP